jgi:cobalamin-dependent methionine synthase I
MVFFPANQVNDDDELTPQLKVNLLQSIFDFATAVSKTKIYILSDFIAQKKVERQIIWSFCVTTGLVMNGRQNLKRI